MDTEFDIKNNIIVFTDGSKTRYRCGYGVYFINEEFKSYGHSFKIEPLTNQRAELYAVISALKMINNELNEERRNYKKIIIYSDSLYTIQCYNKYYKTWNVNGWKTANNEEVKNKDIIKLGLSTINFIKSKYKIDVEFIHVKSHTGNKDPISLANEIADILATKKY